jgi:transcriptional regulator with XRE-family HTH domain
MQTIGERLEEARKKKGISIREAAEATKIRGDYLQKFESNHFDIGLTEIYTRGFLRGYANFLKLPADRILNDYAALGRGEIRPRQPSREIYGRMDISVSSAGEPSDRAAPPEEGGEDPAPARATPRYPRNSGTALPTGPDPAVVFQYMKIGGIAILVIVLVIVGRSLFTGKPTAREAAATPAAAAPTQPASAAGASFTLVALDVVHVAVYRKSGETEGEELFKGWLAKGETKSVAWTSEVYIRASEGANLKIEIKGKRYDSEFRGNGRSALPEPIR